VWIETPTGIVPTYKSSYTPNWNRAATLKILEERTDCGFALVAKTKHDGFGYFLIFDQGKATDEKVGRAIEAIGKLRDAPGFLVDLRSASGGDERKLGTSPGCSAEKTRSTPKANTATAKDTISSRRPTTAS
jgi:hypothetical protein